MSSDAKPATAAPHQSSFTECGPCSAAPSLACLSPLGPLGEGGSQHPCCWANTLQPLVADPGMGIEGECNFKLAVDAGGLPITCHEMYGVQH